MSGEKQIRPVDSIYWIEVDKIKPNPFQPRTEFNDDRLRNLADSIRQYGVLQPLVVTRKEKVTEEGGLVAEYELIAGERRWRAAKIAGLSAVPALIRTGDDTDKLKLEMAIIENLQREDLNPVDRAQAFSKLVHEFNMKHLDIARRIGKSREFVSNSLRLLALPQEILDALIARQITEGHTRPILMLIDRPAEQATLFKEIMLKKLTVREAESIARRIAFEKVRKEKYLVEPEIIEIEGKLTEKYGGRVKVEKRDNGGRVTIDFFSQDDLMRVLGMLEQETLAAREIGDPALAAFVPHQTVPDFDRPAPVDESKTEAVDDSTIADQSAAKDKEDEDLYFVKNFSI